MDKIAREISELRGKNNGFEPAFANYDVAEDELYVGLSKREYFAGLAMQAIISNGKYSQNGTLICAVKFADELLQELEAKKP